MRGLLQGLLDELRGGVWVSAAGDDVRIAVEMADGRHWAEVCTFDAEGLPVDPRYYLRRLSGTKGLPARTAVPQARLEPLGLGGTAVPAFSRSTRTAASACRWTPGPLRCGATPPRSG